MEPVCPRNATASQVGNHLVYNFYLVLQHRPHDIYEFYSNRSTRVHVDGQKTHKASTLQEIIALTGYLLCSKFDIKTVASLECWLGSVLVTVCGTVRNNVLGFKRTFVETFLLVPEDNGLLVLNDIFQFTDEQFVYEQHRAPISSEIIRRLLPTPVSSEDNHDNGLNPSSSLPLPSAVSYNVLEEEVRNSVDLVNLEDDPVDEYSLPEQQQHKSFATEVVVENPLPEQQLKDFATVVGSRPLLEQQQQKDFATEVVVGSRPLLEQQQQKDFATEVVVERPLPEEQQQKYFATEVVVESPVPEQQQKDFATEVVVERPPVPELQQQKDFATEIVVEKSPREETAAMSQGAANAMRDPPAAALEESVQVPIRKTYASVLRFPKGYFSSSVAAESSANSRTPIPQPTAHQPDSGSSFSSESGYETAEEDLEGDKRLSS